MSNKYLNPNEDCISIYMRDVRKSDLITAEKEVELAKKILNGDKRALDELVKANLRFVIKIAKEYQNQGLAAADLISFKHLGSGD